MIRPMRHVMIFSLLWAGMVQAPAYADLINFTGDVENDFALTNQNVIRVLDFNGQTGDVAQPQWMTDQGKINGWNVKDLRLNYDKATDTMYVGANFFGVAGDVDGNGVVGTSTDQFKAAGGLELPNIGGRSSISVGFGPNSVNGSPTAVAGISGDKTQSGPGLNGFSVAAALSGQALGMNFGPSLAANQGTLFNNGPDFEFTVNNFSKLPGINLANGIGVNLYAGSPDDLLVGEDSMPYYTIGKLSPIIVPEPTTILAWTFGVAVLGLHARRRTRIANRNI